MNLIKKIFFLNILLCFVISSKMPEEIENKKEYDLNLKSLPSSELNSLVTFIFSNWSLFDLINMMHELLVLKNDYSLHRFLEPIDMIFKASKEFLSLLENTSFELSDKFANKNDFMDTAFLEEIYQRANKNTSKNSLDNLVYLFSELRSLSCKSLEEFKKIRYRLFCCEDFIYLTKVVLSDLQEFASLKIKLLENQAEEIFKDNQELNMKAIHADITAHRLLGCCQDGTCGSLNKKKLEKKNKKASRKKRKSDKKLELGAYAKENELEDIDQPESSEERQLNNIDKNSDEESNSIQNREKSSLHLIQNQDLGGNQVGYSKDILNDSINLTSKILSILSSILELEINLHNLISKSKILYKYLLKERVRNYESSKKDRLNSLLRESLKYINLNLIENNKYGQSNSLLKCCFLSKSQSKEKSRKNNYCVHCKCGNCNKNLNKKKSIYSVN